MKFLFKILLISSGFILSQNLITDVNLYSNGDIEKIYYYKKNAHQIELIKKEYYYESDIEAEILNSLSQVENYKNGKLEGLQIEYDIDGEIISEVTYRDGKFWDGEFIEYEVGDGDNYNDIIQQYIMKNGKIWEGEYKIYYDNGQISEIKNYKNGKLNGESTGYYNDNSISYKMNYLFLAPLTFPNHSPLID